MGGQRSSRAPGSDTCVVVTFLVVVDFWVLCVGSRFPGLVLASLVSTVIVFIPATTLVCLKGGVVIKGRSDCVKVPGTGLSEHTFPSSPAFTQ